MSAAQGPYRWDDPFRTGMGTTGMYDPGTMYGLMLRARQGDAASAQHLTAAGLAPNAWQNPNYHQVVSQWAQGKGLKAYNGPNPFQWNSTWADAKAPGFEQAWNAQWGGGQQQTPPAPPAPGTPNPVNPATLQSTGHNVALAQGAGGAQVAAGAPAWAKYTAGKTGSGYAALVGRFDPWGAQSTFGVPNGAKKHQRGEYMESDVDRVYRWTNDILRNHYGGNGENVDPNLRTQVFLANVERLKQEYGNNGLDWNRSDFAHWDRQLAQGGQQTTPPAGGQTQQTGQQQQQTTGGTQNTLPEGYAGQNGGAGGAGSLSAAHRMALSSDPQQAYRYMMQQIGYNPSAPGLLGNFLKQRFQPLLEARMAASNVNDSSNYMDTIDQVIGEFGGGLFQKGGNFFGGLQQAGRQAAQQGAPFLDNLQDQEQAMQYLRQLGMLNYAGTNPMVQQAQADEMRRGMESYQDYSFDEELSGRNIDPFTAWLRKQPRFRGTFGY